MDKFPEWASDWLLGEPALVSHGLNLALPLKHPDRMPWLLWDIVVARPKIQQALDGLSFIHYARFVPSWEGTALMVITEFDGPLEPYVMDFAVAIGDVFDRLLSYVVEPPPLPISSHPEAFWHHVQRWNRVPFTRRGPGDAALFPEGYDYPLYSAYRTLSAIDIAGPRSALPPPALDRPAAHVDLADVQGNLLRGYGARAAEHLFFSVRNAAAALAWLSKTLVDATSGDGRAWGGVMNASVWPVGADGQVSKPAVMTNVALTFSGLKALMPGRATEFDKRFPEAFRQGAEQRAGDNGDLKESPSAPAGWLFGRDAQQIHVVVMLHSFADEADPPGWERFLQARDALQDSARRQGLALVGSHPARALPGDQVYFGYRDGITQPRISGQCPVGRVNFQPASSPGEFLLGEQYVDIFGGPSIGRLPRDVATNGSFAAMRLLEQYVDHFEKMLDEESVRLGVARADLKARLMGRAADGTPVTLAGGVPVADDRLDAFDYAPSWEHPDVVQDHDGHLCPVGSHIRRTNPRNARVAGQRHSRRLLRRGMPSHWQEGGATKKGLLGLFVCGSLERQFEFIQRQWIQGDLAASGIRGTQDPIAGLRSEPTDFTVAPGSPPARIPPLVRTRGSLYLFFPGLQALRGLKDAGPAPAPGWEGAVAPVVGNLPRIAQTAIEKAWAPASVYTARALDFLSGVASSLTGGSSADNAQSIGRYGFNLIADLADQTQQALSVADDTWAKAERSLIQLAQALKLPEQAREMLLDLLLRGLDSAWFRQLLEHFIPSEPPAVQPAGFVAGDIDPAAPRFIAHPFDDYLALRGGGRKLVWVPRHRAYWVLTQAEAQAVLNDHAGFRQQPSAVSLRGLITLDNPRHDEVRAAVEAAMRIAAEQNKVTRLVGDAVAAAFGRIGDLPQFDAVKLYCQPVPGQVFWDILGVPEGYREECASLAHTMMRHFGQPDRPGMGDRVVFADASVRLTTRLLLMLTQALAGSLLPDALNPYAGSLIGEIARRTRIGISVGPARAIDFLEALLTLLQFVLAGFMSMQFLMGTALLNLLSADPRGGGRPTPWQALAALNRPGSPTVDAPLKGAIDEARRHDPPVTLVQRYAGPSGARIGGVDIPKDCPVYVVVASANRDGTPADQLEQYWWDRTGAAPHLSLGHGIHECIGRALQDWVVPQAMRALLDQMPGLQLCDAESTPAWLDNLYFRALQSLPVQRCR